MKPSYKQLLVCILGFEMVSLSSGIWGWKSGLSFVSIVPGSFIAGVVGGAFLSAAIHVVRTGWMERGSIVYRFSDRPITFIMDCIMLFLGITLSLAWPIGYSIQELSK